MTGEFHPSSTHPPLPPTTEDSQFIHLRLLRSRRVGATTYHRLLTEHGSAQNALAALPQVARAAGVSDYEICPEAVIEKELRAGRRAGARLLIHGHAGYPTALYDQDNAPPVLWALGQIDLLERPAIAMVGARNASALGTRMAKSLSAALGDLGYIVVSGLARGIDAAVHHAALSTGTIAVQAGGVDIMYPAENTDLAQRIGENGLRVSEQPLGLQPQARHFPARNRIIAGLAQACVVVEAAAKSGSLITARDAADLGRDVLAVPGHPFDARAAGCNILIRDGATLVRNANDIAEALGPIATAGIEKVTEGTPVRPFLTDARPKTAPQTPPQKATIARLHNEILSRLGPSPVAEDLLIREIAADPQTIGAILVDLELSGDIERHAGSMISRQR